MPQYAQLARLSQRQHAHHLGPRQQRAAASMRIIERIDESGDEPIDVIALHNASAADVVRIITSLNQGAGAEGAGAAVKVVADERTNSILLTGEKSQRLRVKTLIVDMDTPLSSGGDTQVRYLRYADAEKIAEKLKGQAIGNRQGPGRPSLRAHARTGGGGGSNVDASVTIWADIATNALIITAPPKIMRSLMAGDRQTRHSPCAGAGRGSHRRGRRQQEFQPRRPMAAVRTGQRHRSGRGRQSAGRAAPASSIWRPRS